MYRILLILLLIPVISNAAQIVRVEEGSSPFVQVSSEDLNHIMLPIEVDKAYTSTDKPIDIKVEGKHAFIKILDPDYHIPIEVFFIGDQTYSLLLVPIHVPAETIILTQGFEDTKKALAWEREYPYEETIKNLMIAMVKEKIPDGFLIDKVQKQIKSPYENTRLFLKKRYTGAELAGEVYIISNMRSSDLVVEEKDFFTDRVLAVTTEDNNLAPATSGHIYIIKLAGHTK